MPFQPALPSGLIRGLVERLFDGDQLSANPGHNPPHFFPRLPLHILQFQDPSGMPLDLGIGQYVYRFRFAHYYFLS